MSWLLLILTEQVARC